MKSPMKTTANRIRVYFIDETTPMRDQVESLNNLLRLAHRTRGVVTVGVEDYGVRSYAIGFRRCTAAFMRRAHKLARQHHRYL